MQSKIIKTLIFSALILFLFTGIAAAQEWVVTAPGDIDKVNLSTVNPDNMTLREAIGKAASGDTILFADNISAVSTVYGTLNISKDLTIGGDSKVTVARDSGSVTPSFSIFAVSGGTVVFKHLSIENGNLVNGTGGAVTVDSASVVFDSCTIQRNRGDFGGAVYVANGSNVKFITSSIYRNNAVTDGSAIYVKNGTVELQNSIISGHSDKYNVIRLDQGKIIASQSRVIDNTVTSKGSPLNASAGTVVEFRNSTFSNNTATESAGIMTSGTLLVENCVFNGGITSGNGGGISLGSGSNGTVKSSVFSNSTVTGDGGGISISAGSTVSVDTCTFFNNSANYGGAVFSRGTVNANAVTAVNNTAKFYGGALAFWNDGDTTLTKSAIAGNTAKSNNTAKDIGGGGLNISNSRAVLSDNVIVGNTDPRSIDFGEFNASVQSGGRNLVGTYNGSGRFPIDSADAAGLQPADLFVIENGLPSLTKATGQTAGFDNIPVYTIALNSSSSNPAAGILGDGRTQPPAPEPQEPQDPSSGSEVNQTPGAEPPAESGSSLLMYLILGIIAVILLVVIAVGIVFFLIYREKRKYKFG
ncbi:MAG: hypothetical protein LBU81_08435 [Methanosarcinales archaeon]|jgi:hypothetical protein|nr:hypothetical protein [Methanosarcinales archaeon]